MRASRVAIQAEIDRLAIGTREQIAALQEIVAARDAELASIKPVRKAKSYELRYGAVGAGGATPSVWSTLMAPKAKTAVPIDGLTPGTTYAVQVRAYGQLGYTPYSDSVTRMVI